MQKPKKRKRKTTKFTRKTVKKKEIIMGNSTSGQSTLSRRYHEATGTGTASRKMGTNRSNNSNNNNYNNPENSRVLFLLYLIHRTWNVVVDSVDQKGKR